MATGRVLQFDQARGYGFVAADDGGEDVFLHASVFDGDPDELRPGIKVTFQVMAGDRGRKAFAARLIDEPGPGNRPVPVSSAPAVPASRPVPPPSADPESAALVAPAVPVPAPRAPGGEQEDEQMCDVLSPAEFGQELTELLLSNALPLTGQQIREVRQSVLDLASKHGWIDL